MMYSANVRLFLECPAYTQILHSFPTRRSSDLSQAATATQRIGLTDITISYSRPLVNGRKVWDARSEEHTSELQSHSELVCRLLLEKKNNHLPRIFPNVYHGYE